jgi:hypothetical protein
MRGDDATLTRGAFETLRVRPAEQSFLRGRAQIAAARSKTLNNVRSDVLVGKEGEIERLHAVILSSHVCSPFITSAA